jgi:DNA-binding winged helix-turn-helix (wHTH) protein/tetratricopeptide (TPR) repeat protein
MPEPAKGTRVARFGAFEVNFVAGELRKHGVRLKVQEQPFQVLVLLLAHPGELVTREEIQQKLWPSGTFVDFENGLNTAINRLREALGDSAENPRFVVTEPRRGYRFIAPVNGHPRSDANPRSLWGTLLVIVSRFKWSVIASLVTVAMLAIGGFFYVHRAPTLADSHSIIVADFTNTTGDPVFDGTLRQGLAVQLEQSPFLDIVSDDQIQQTLSLMEQATNVKLTSDLAKQVCLRLGAATVLDGSIANLGGEYVIGLNARDCHTGRTLAQAQSTANEKSKVLSALGKVGTQIRGRLGESLASIQEYDAPLQDVTTSSLEALQAYSLGEKARWAGDIPTALSFFNRAISLDPNFAMAYATLGVVNGDNYGEIVTAAKNIRKAYDLRSRVSEKERLFIEVAYHEYATPSMEEMLRATQVWAQTYPRDVKPHMHSGIAYMDLDRYDKALEELLEISRLSPATTAHYNLLAVVYLHLGRIREAKEVVRVGLERMPQHLGLHVRRYEIAFLEGDEAGMAEQVDYAIGKSRDEEVMFAEASYTAAFHGKRAEADMLMQRAMTSGLLAGQEQMDDFEDARIMRDAFFGKASEVKREAPAAQAADRRSGNPGGMTAIALALSGDASQARKLADDLSKKPTEAECRLHTLRAVIALNQGDPSNALAELKLAAPYVQNDNMFFDYLRGIAYLAAHQGGAAAAEFNKILAHPYLLALSDHRPMGALAHLGLARAYAMQGDTAESKVAYQDFLALWRDADPDIPILIAAKSEFAKLN